MKNKPKCLYCQKTLEAQAVTINRGLTPFNSLGNTRSLNAIVSEEITLRVVCPNCGAYGEGIGDYAHLKGNSSHRIVEIQNVNVMRLMTGNELLEAYRPVVVKFNPSKRTQ